MAFMWVLTSILPIGHHPDPLRSSISLIFFFLHFLIEMLLKGGVVPYPSLIVYLYWYEPVRSI